VYILRLAQDERTGMVLRSLLDLKSGFLYPECSIKCEVCRVIEIAFAK